jgi:hypothetical protein
MSLDIDAPLLADPRWRLDTITNAVAEVAPKRKTAPATIASISEKPRLLLLVRFMV